MAKFGRDGANMNVHMCGSSRGEDDQVTIDVDSLTSSVETMMSQNLKMSDKCCIFRVPLILQRHNEKAYFPNAFSIGPWHRNGPLMKATEEVKLKYLKGLLFQARERITLKKLMKAIREIETEARECYAEPIDVCEEDFAKILFIDGCFLIELFRKGYGKNLREDDDPIFNMSCMLQYLCHDLILVENQIPWFVVELLFNMIVETGSEPPLAILALHFFVKFFSFTPPLRLPTDQGQKHLLDLLRNWLFFSPEKEEDAESIWEPIPSVTDLVEAGIELKVRHSRSILNIQFSNGVLEIPPLIIHENTEVLIRNLISYEQCCPKCTDRITSYAVLLDNLINTTKDMDILTTTSKIIYNYLNPDDATQFFNKLCRDAYVKNYYYIGLCQKVNKYRKRRWPRWRAVLMRNYFGTPWAIVSLFAAVVLLILTVVQTIYSVS